MIRTREILVESRTKLIGHLRGAVKSFGARLPKCSTEAFVNKTRKLIPEQLRTALDPVYVQIEHLSRTIADYDRQIENMAEQRYPEVERVAQVKGVGTLTGLSFVLVLEDASRFRRSRSVGAFLGLTSKRDQSGESDPQRRITKAGDRLMRRLLIRPGAIGDLLVSLPQLESLRAEYLEVWVAEQNVPLIRFADGC